MYMTIKKFCKRFSPPSENLWIYQDTTRKGYGALKLLGVEFPATNEECVLGPNFLKKDKMFLNGGEKGLQKNLEVFMGDVVRPPNSTEVEWQSVHGHWDNMKG